MSRDRATDILDVLSAMGGVSRYLEEVNPALPAARVTRGEFEGSDIHLVCDEIDDPKGVRYLHEFPWAGYIYADSGLPLAAFIREW